jgi:transcriptional regulator with XRE-family HTH domain
MAKTRRRLRPALLRAREAGRLGGGEVLRAVGRQIRGLRRAREMTLSELAARSGLSVSYLSQVERSISNPSVIALHDIGRALDVNIGWFFAEGGQPPAEEAEYIVRAKQRRRLPYDGGIVDELLSPSLNGDLELLISRFPPGATSGDKPYTHKGEEAGVVIAGSLELWIGERKFLLGEGDSFTFASTLPHRYRNPGRGEAVVIWAITPPSY